MQSGIPNLTAIRTSRGLSLQQIAAATKIGVFYLQAIEEGQLEKLPGAVYTRSYIRQYARVIDYNEEELLARFQVGEQDKEVDERAEPTTRFGRLMAGIFAIVGMPRHEGTRKLPIQGQF
jgi:cytoskeletal protein RodZ